MPKPTKTKLTKNWNAKMTAFYEMLNSGEPEVITAVTEWLQSRLTVNIRPEQVECPKCCNVFST